MNSIKRWLISGSLSLFFFILFFSVADLSLGYFHNDSVAYMCRDPFLHHKYCPEASRTYRMSSLDGGEIKESHWNKSSVRVERLDDKHTRTNFNDFKNIFIGDSFIAQRQVEYEERLSSIINAETENSMVIQFGTGSWNMLTYLQAIRDINPSKGQVVHVFLMANDFYSFYGWSTKDYVRKFAKLGLDKVDFNRSSESFNSRFWRWLANNSFTYQLINYKLKPTRTNDSAGESRNLPLITENDIVTDCSKLGYYREILGDSLAFSLVEHSFDQSCFTDQANLNLEAAKNINHHIQRLAEKSKFSVKYYFIPNGTYDKEEGRSFKEGYGLNEGTSVTSEGMRRALEISMGVPVFSIESIFKKNSGDVLVYYPYDGHWNAAGSKMVAQHLIKTHL